MSSRTGRTTQRSQPKESDTGGYINPMALLQSAIRAVPAVKYALGVGGILAVITIIGSFGLSYRVAFVGTVALFLGMLLLLLFANAAGLPGQKRKLPALIFTWFGLFAFVSTWALLMSSVFFKRPLDLHFWLSAGSVSSAPEQQVIRKAQATITGGAMSPLPDGASVEHRPSEQPTLSTLNAQGGSTIQPITTTNALSSLPDGVSTERRDATQTEIVIEITATGVVKHFFFNSHAEMKVVRETLISQLGLIEQTSLGSPRTIHVSWVLVDKALTKPEREMSASTCGQCLVVFKSMSGKLVQITSERLIAEEPLTLESAEFPRTITFNIHPVLIGPDDIVVRG